MQKFTDKNNLLRLIDGKAVVKVELGPGLARFVKDAITIDKYNGDAVDIVANFEEGLEFLPDNSVDYMYSRHVMEHIGNIELLLSEIFRVLKPNGVYEFIVPHFSNPYFYSDYTHKTFFGLYSMSYFSKTPYFKRGVPTFYNDFSFVIDKVRLEFTSPFIFRYPIKKFWQFLFNLSKPSQEFYEECLSSVISAYQIRFYLRKPNENTIST